MKIATPDMITKIDSFAVNRLNISATELMRRSAVAVCNAVLSLTKEGDFVIILAGKGNNGGDGYAASKILSESRRVLICDVFSAGQRTEEGKYWLENCSSEIICGLTEELFCLIDKCDCVVDGIFGTGMTGEIPTELSPLTEAVNSTAAKVVAIDLPLGVNAYDGSVSEICIKADVTVALSFMKPGLLSYPARDFVGELRLCDLSLPKEKVEEAFEFKYRFTDEDEVRLLLPKRETRGNKGSFGRVGLIVGCEKYLGAAHLSLEAALRGGAGLTYFIGDEKIIPELRSKFPEAIYVTPKNLEELKNTVLGLDSLLIGSGSGTSEELYELIKLVLEDFDGQLIIDADGLNSIARFGTPDILKTAKKQPIITPHPLELSRLSGSTVAEIEKCRLGFARDFSNKYNCILLLKGAATVITDGDRVYINGSGSSALAKGGAGDALSGLIVSLLASGSEPLSATALAAYVHGRAGDTLAKQLSPIGVTPSDLPLAMAKELALLYK